MELTLKTALTQNPQGTELYIEFENATGLYDAVDNPGGFGGVNPARNTLAVLILATHKLVAGDQPGGEIAYNPLTVSSFTFPITKSLNGVLNYNIFALPIFDPIGVYVDGNVVWDNQNPLAPFVKERVAGVWTQRTLSELIGNATVTQKNSNAFPIPDAITFLNSLNALKFTKLREVVMEECSCEDYEAYRNQFEYVEGLIKNATSAYCAQAYNEAQINIEEIFTFEPNAIS